MISTWGLRKWLKPRSRLKKIIKKMICKRAFFCLKSPKMMHLGPPKVLSQKLKWLEK